MNRLTEDPFLYFHSGEPWPTWIKGRQSKWSRILLIIVRISLTQVQLFLFSRFSSWLHHEAFQRTASDQKYYLYFTVPGGCWDTWEGWNDRWSGKSDDPFMSRTSFRIIIQRPLSIQHNQCHFLYAIISIIIIYNKVEKLVTLVIWVLAGSKRSRWLQRWKGEPIQNYVDLYHLKMDIN